MKGKKLTRPFALDLHISNPFPIIVPQEMIRTEYIIYNGVLHGRIVPEDAEEVRKFTIPFNIF